MVEGHNDFRSLPPRRYFLDVKFPLINLIGNFPFELEETFDDFLRHHVFGVPKPDIKLPAFPRPHALCILILLAYIVHDDDATYI